MIKLYCICSGDQPSGRMAELTNGRADCAGYERKGRIEITYTFQDGRQGASCSSVANVWNYIISWSITVWLTVTL